MRLTYSTSAMFLTLALVSLSLPASARALSPPWIVTQNEIATSLTADPCVTIDQVTAVSGDYELSIHVCADDKAQALANLLKSSYDFGNVKLSINVLNSCNTRVPAQPFSGELNDIDSLVTTALTGNTYFNSVIKRRKSRHPFPYSTFIVFNKQVIQYWGDNLADAYGNFNKVAAEAFRDILDLDQFKRVQVSTVKEE